MAVLSLPVVLLNREYEPVAVLYELILEPRALKPVAVFSFPVVFTPRANVPVAVLLLPVRLALSELDPIAVLLLPVVFVKRDLYPIAAFSDPESDALGSASTPNATFKVPRPPELVLRYVLLCAKTEWADSKNRHKRKVK